MHSIVNSPLNYIRYWTVLISWILFSYWTLIWTMLVLLCCVLFGCLFV